MAKLDPASRKTNGQRQRPYRPRAEQQGLPRTIALALALAWLPAGGSLGLALWPAGAAAQSPPTGGTLMQQVEPAKIPALPRAERPPVPSGPPAATAPVAGPSVRVLAFRFSGRTLLSEDLLQRTVAPWLGRPLGFADLSQATAAVTEAYREAGWLARAELPRQDITEGLVEIRILEARFAGAVVEGPPARRVQAAQVQALVEHAQRTGDPLQLEAIDRALLLIQDLPGIQSRGELRAGAQAGQTQMAITLTDSPAWNADLGLDNAGSRATGPARFSANLSALSPLGLGDQAGLQFSHSQGSDYLRLAYSAPVGAAGWRLGANASELRYEIITPEFSSLGAQGPSQSVGAEASVPLLRSRPANLYLQLSADRKRFRNEAAGSVASRYRVDVASATLAGNRVDDWGGGGVNSGSLQWVSGRVDLAGSPNQAADAATTRTAGGYTRVRVSASRRQRIDERTSVWASAQGQWADKNLDGSEKFYLGGAGGVRAYPANEAGGSTGRLLTLELQRALPVEALEGLTVATFIDAGHVQVNRSNDYPGASALNSYTLKGAGAWVAVALPSSLGTTQLRLTWAQRIGCNPAAGATGLDQDGSKTRNRIWVNANLVF